MASSPMSLSSLLIAGPHCHPLSLSLLLSSSPMPHRQTTSPRTSALFLIANSHCHFSLPKHITRDLSFLPHRTCSSPLLARHQSTSPETSTYFLIASPHHHHASHSSTSPSSLFIMFSCEFSPISSLFCRNLSCR